MNKNLTVIQDGIKECGSACLLSIIRYYGGNTSKGMLLELTNTTKEGTNFYSLSNAAKELGLASKAYKIENINDLFKIDKPFISQIIINNYTHFVVVYKISNNKITIMDPAKGMKKIDLNEFIKLWTSYILLLEPIKELPKYNESNYILNILSELINNNKKIIFNLILHTTLITVFTCIYSYHFKIIIDDTINTNKINLLIVSVIFIIILSIKTLLEFLRNKLILYLNEKIDLSIITTTIDKIISLPYNYYKNKTTGEMISRVNDLFYIKNVISKIISSLFLDILISIVTFIILFKINSKMTFILLIIVIIYFLIFLIYKRITQKLTNIIQEDNAYLNSLLVESISSYETIKGLNIEDRQKKLINKTYLKSIKDNIYLNDISLQQELLKNIFEGIIIIFIIYLGVSNIMDNNFTIGSLITYNTLIYYFLNPIRSSLDFYQEFYYVKNSIKRINNLLNLNYEKLDQETNLLINGNIKINKLEFSYNKASNILNCITLDVKDKEKVLLLGSSGCGKSTLLKILYKYYEIKRDSIYINNYDINDLTLKDIRKNITYISQNEYLYTDTIRNNIVLDRDIIEEEFLKVCELTEVTEIVKDKMLSYNFVLEENGINISGGQRQRIILARALLKKSKIILIDEGLNEIDIDLERKILKRIFEYYHDITFIIVSHRLDNMDLYDKVIKLTGGKVGDILYRNE